MQQTQQREVSERISWARAVIFAVGFFFLAALLLGQIPGYIYYQMTASLISFEQGLLGIAIAALAGFVVIQVIVLLFDPKAAGATHSFYRLRHNFDAWRSGLDDLGFIRQPDLSYDQHELGSVAGWQFSLA